MEASCKVTMSCMEPSFAPKPEQKPYRSDLTDAECALLQPLLPATRSRNQQRVHSLLMKPPRDLRRTRCAPT